MKREIEADWKSFSALVALQAQNAFNDKMSQFLIIPLAFWLTLNGGDDYTSMPHILAVLIVLPYLLLAPVAGWLADRFPKTSIIRWSALLQTGVLGAMLLSIISQNVWGAVGCFFILAIQSTILNPAKRGVIKELVGESNLGSASGFLEMSVVLAVCSGQIIAGFWFAQQILSGKTAWDTTSTILWFLLSATLIPIILSFFIKKTEAKSVRPFSRRLLIGHFGQLKLIWKDRGIRLCALGKSFFWGYAGVLNLWQFTFAGEMAKLSGNEYSAELSRVMLATSGGVLVGGVAASLFSRKRIELGLLPIGGFLMLIGVLFLAFSQPGVPFMYTAFCISGFGGAVFLVPLNGQLQNLAPEEERGSILAGASVLDCLFGLLAVAFQFSLSHFEVPMVGQGLTLAVIILAMFAYLVKLVAKDCLRFLVRTIFRALYKVKVEGAHNIPKEGGVLLTPNHISYVDSLILSVGCPRPVRFLMIRDCFDNPFVGWFARFADTIPISRERAKEAVSSAATALKEGTVVCIFPEGQLTRTGALCEIKRGFEMIARQAKAPVIPVYMDGLWGSLLSFERNKMFFKMPRRYPRGVRVHFGESLLGKAKVNCPTLSLAMYQLSRDCLMSRREVTDEKWFRKQLERVSLPISTSDRIRGMSWSELQPYVFNAVQVRELGVFRNRTRLGYEEGAGTELTFIMLTVILKGSLWIYKKSDTLNTREISKCDYLFMGERLRPDLSKFRGCLVFDVDGEAVHESVLEPRQYPIRTSGDKIELCSMPHPSKIKPHDPLQPGWKHNSKGRILPGAELVPTTSDKEFFVIEKEKE